MSSAIITISGTGCALADYLYKNIRFDSPQFQKYASRKPGDGGLSPGKLVFTEELEKFSGKRYPTILAEITGNTQPDSVNIGGPSLVSMIHAAQMLEGQSFEVRFYGNAGKDKTRDKIFDLLQRTPLTYTGYQSSSEKATATTDVFSDPTYDNGHGERTFVNNIGAAWDYFPENLDSQFFNSQIVCFGGTALVPQIHDNLTYLLTKAKKNNCITVVNTVFDFRNEKKNPGLPWPLVEQKADYGLIDLLIMDREEAIRISGMKNMDEAAEFFSSTDVSSFIITNGAEKIAAWSGGGLFEKTDRMKMPVSNTVVDKIKSDPRQKGDTTGCGDNFTGGMVSSLAWQMKKNVIGKFSLPEAVSWGVASGGFCCFTVGGTYLETAPGEKRKEVEQIQKAYLDQIAL